jgi:CRP/FNR family transcriptional regulator, cyclic AMP receptor protein
MHAADLDAVPLFGRLTPDEREEFASFLQPRDFRRGETIFAEGGPEETFYILASGNVEVSKRVHSGRKQRLAMVQAPTVVGEMGLLTEPRACASVVARSEVKAYGIERDQFLELLDADNPAACKVVHEIGRTLAERMARTDETVSDLIAELESRESRDLGVFGDRLIRDWSF